MLFTTFFALVWAACSTGVGALKNPIIRGWNPDAHVLRVNDTYYIATSSFNIFPGVPIYRSKNLVDWELVSHAINRPEAMPLYSSRAGNGIWAPSLSYTDGLFYMTSMAMWGSDPDNRTWPRIFWVTSRDLTTWSDPTWADPSGIDPHLFRDPATSKDYLTLMGLDNNYDRIWGITQCEVDLATGKCTGPYRNIWNGTLPVSPTARPEGPKLFLKDGFYYLLIAEGGTGITHRATIARSTSPSGPWDATSPTNPLLFNGADPNLTIGNTGHATFATTPNGTWFATFLAKRYTRRNAPLGRETFFAPVTWDAAGWPTVNHGRPVLPSQRYPHGPDRAWPPPNYEDAFASPSLAPTWYQLRTPYTPNYALRPGGGIMLRPNVYTLSDRDTPAALLRKQLSTNMTFSATLARTKAPLSPSTSVGISVYQSEANHQDIGLRGCADGAGMCVFVDATRGGAGPGTRPVTEEVKVGFEGGVPGGVELWIRAEAGRYRLGYSLGEGGSVVWVREVGDEALPSGFDGAMWAVFASGNGRPVWGEDVGFEKVREEYFEERWGDYMEA